MNFYLLMLTILLYTQCLGQLPTSDGRKQDCALETMRDIAFITITCDGLISYGTPVYGIKFTTQ